MRSKINQLGQVVLDSEHRSQYVDRCPAIGQAVNMMAQGRGDLVGTLAVRSCRRGVEKLLRTVVD